jgi:hypothetical protein
MQNGTSKWAVCATLLASFCLVVCTQNLPSDECTDDATVKLEIVTPATGAVVESPVHLRSRVILAETGALSQCVLAEPREWWSCAAVEPAELGAASPPIQVDDMPEVCVRMDEALGFVMTKTLIPPLALSPQRYVASAWLERQSFGQQIGKRIAASTSTFQVSAPQPAAFQPLFGCAARDYLPQLRLPCDYTRDAQLNLTWTTLVFPLHLAEYTAGSTHEVIALFGDQFDAFCREAQAQQMHTLDIEACVCEIEGNLVSHLVKFCARRPSHQFRQGPRVLKNGTMPLPAPGLASVPAANNGMVPGRADFCSFPNGSDEFGGEDVSFIDCIRRNGGRIGAFVMYASIFGNYRNEENGIEEVLSPLAKFDVDRFLFTDSTTIGDIPGWTVVHVPTGEGVNGIPAPRVRTKEIKFKGHDRINHYRYRISVDLQSTARSTRGLADALNNGLLDYVRCNPSKALFVRKHPDRTTIQQEVNELENWDSLQPQPPLDEWDAYLKPLYTKLNTVQLAETNLFVLDTHHREFVNKWASIYDTLLEGGYDAIKLCTRTRWSLWKTRWNTSTPTRRWIHQRRVVGRFISHHPVTRTVCSRVRAGVRVALAVCSIVVWGFTVGIACRA